MLGALDKFLPVLKTILEIQNIARRLATPGVRATRTPAWCGICQEMRAANSRQQKAANKHVWVFFQKKPRVWHLPADKGDKMTQVTNNALWLPLFYFLQTSVNRRIRDEDTKYWQNVFGKVVILTTFSPGFIGNSGCNRCRIARRGGSIS